MKRPLISADCHVTEPLDLWSGQLPAALKDIGPRIEFADGRGAFMIEDKIAMKLPPLPKSSGKGSARRDGVLSGLPVLDMTHTLAWVSRTSNEPAHAVCSGDRITPILKLHFRTPRGWLPNSSRTPRK